jgi:hypothetical protein
MYANHAKLDWLGSPNAAASSRRRAVDPVQFDRWACELAYGAHGLALMGGANGSGNHGLDTVRQTCEASDLRAPEDPALRHRNLPGNKVR